MDIPGRRHDTRSQEDLLLLNPNAAALTVRAAFYLASGRIVSATVRVPGRARYTLSVNGVRGLPGTLHGAQLASANGLGFIAEQSIYNSDGTTAYGGAGLAQ